MTADRGTRSSPRAMPGWYEVAGDPLDRLFWDGSRWLARARFVDGAWREHALPDDPALLPSRPAAAAPVVAAGWNGGTSAPGGVGVFGGAADHVPGSAEGAEAAGARTPGSGAAVGAAQAEAGLPPLGPVGLAEAGPPPLGPVGLAEADPAGEAGVDAAPPGRPLEGGAPAGTGAPGDRGAARPLHAGGAAGTAAEIAAGPVAAAAPSDIAWSWPGDTGGPWAVAPGARGVDVRVAHPVRQRRWTVLLRLVLALPHLVCLYLAAVAVAVCLVAMWLAALVTRRVPPSLWAFVWGYTQWYGRVGSYLLLLTDRYPPFELGDAPYPVRFRLLPPSDMNRFDVLFRACVAVPASIAVSMLAVGLAPVGLVAWATTLVLGRLPVSFHLAFAAAARFLARALAFSYLLTNAFPSAPLGDDAGAGPEALVVSYGARSVLAWAFGLSGIFWLALPVAIPVFLGVSPSPAAAAGSQQFAAAERFALDGDRYAVVAQAAQQAVLACAGGGSTASALEPSGSGAPVRLVGTGSAGGVACVGPVLARWGSAAGALAADLAGLERRVPPQVAGSLAQASDDAARLGAELGRVAADTDPLAMLQGYEGPVRGDAAILAANLSTVEAQLSAAS